MAPLYTHFSQVACEALRLEPRFKPYFLQSPALALINPMAVLPSKMSDRQKHFLKLFAVMALSTHRVIRRGADPLFVANDLGLSFDDMEILLWYGDTAAAAASVWRTEGF